MVLVISCTKQPYYDIPYDENGNVIITDISVVTSDGASITENTFTINCYFPNAKANDVMVAEVLQRQVPSWDPDGSEQLLPLDGTKKNITVGTNLQTSVTYTLAEANLNSVGDAVTVVFSGETDSGIIQIILGE